MFLKNRLLCSTTVAIGLSTTVIGQSTTGSLLDFFAPNPACIDVGAPLGLAPAPDCDPEHPIGAMFVHTAFANGTITADMASAPTFLSGVVQNAVLDGTEYPLRPASSPRPDRQQHARDKARWHQTRA
jgi:hypothetical protein